MSAFAVFTTLVARMGDASMAASQAFISLLSLSFMQASGLSVAAATLVGRYVGRVTRRRPSAASARRSGPGGARRDVALLFLPYPSALLGLFSEDASVLALGGPLLALGAGFQLLDALGIADTGALRGAGDTRWPFLVQAALAWFVFLPAAWIRDRDGRRTHGRMGRRTRLRRCARPGLRLAFPRRRLAPHPHLRKRNSAWPRGGLEMSDPTRKSGCACGAVEVELEGEPAVQAYCHCSSCRGWLGAPIHAARLWPTSK